MLGSEVECGRDSQFKLGRRRQGLRCTIPKQRIGQEWSKWTGSIHLTTSATPILKRLLTSVVCTMGHHSCNPTMSKVAATLVVVLQVLGWPAFSSARYASENLSLGTPRRGLLESNQPSTVAVDMMHVHHIDSPYMQKNLTLLQRAQDAANRSKQRLSYFSSKVWARRKTLGASEVFTSPVRVQPQLADYVVQITVGNPARTFTVYLDTGSDLVWLQCVPCTTCFREPDPYFNPTQSSTYTKMPCDAPLCLDLANNTCSTANQCLYRYGYLDQSFNKGSMGYETFTFTAIDGSQTAYSNVGFGCGNDQAQGSYYPFDGLVGLGDGPLSLVSQLGSNIEPVFSYCLVSYASANTTTSPLLLGSAGSAALTYTPLITNSFNPTFYYVNLVGLTVNNEPVDYPPGTFAIDSTTGAGGLIIDSGGTITQLFDAAYTPLFDAISALVDYPEVNISGFDLCYDTSSVSTPVFPAVVFQFDGVDVALPPDNVFLPVDNHRTYCMFISSTNNTVLTFSIFGNVQQQNFQIAYDIGNARVGFAPTTC